jgi:hypothetical protein
MGFWGGFKSRLYFSEQKLQRNKVKQSFFRTKVTKEAKETLFYFVSL